MSWFADLAGKAENLLNNIDEQTGAALRSHNVVKRLERRGTSEPATKKNQRPPKKPVDSRTTHSSPPRKSIPSAISPSRGSGSSSISPPRTKSPRKCSPTKTQRIIVGDVLDDLSIKVKVSEKEPIVVKKERRFSHPGTIAKNKIDLLYTLENLEIENTMLKNEVNVMNREVADLLARARVAEEEAIVAKSKVTDYEIGNRELLLENKTLMCQLELTKNELCRNNTGADSNLKEKYKELEEETNYLKVKKTELEKLIEEINLQSSELQTIHNKTQNDLRHAQSTIKVLNSDLEKSNAECKRLEKEWEAYKLRVKSMLGAKDKEIKTLQSGVNLTEDTKILVDQIENLKKEREVLKEEISRACSDLDEATKLVQSLEAKYAAADRVVMALRDALKDERAARNRVEAQCSMLTKELKNIQLDSGKAIADLEATLRDKEQEMQRYQENSANCTNESSALNVADYELNDVCNEQVQLLTQTLIQRQAKIDSLLADKNMLTIQLENLENRHLKELQDIRTKSESILHVQDSGDRGHRVRTSGSVVKVSRRLGVWLKHHPLFRVFVIIYMIGLHCWVFAVLLSSTPDMMTT